MRVLGIDSATLTIGVAIVDGEHVMAEARHNATGRTNDLLVTIDALCKQAGIAPTDLDAIAIGAGPGSFTGLRIGMATAKGIAFAAGKPLWAVSSLAVLARDGSIELAQSTPVTSVASIIAVLDARKGEVYAGCYRLEGRALCGVESVMPPQGLVPWVRTQLISLTGPAPADDLSDHVRGSYFVGDAIDAYPEVFAPLADRWLSARTPSGSSVVVLARANPVDVTVTGAPTYIRASEAEVKYPDGVPGALPRKT